MKLHSESHWSGDTGQKGQYLGCNRDLHEGVMPVTPGKNICHIHSGIDTCSLLNTSRDNKQGACKVRNVFATQAASQKDQESSSYQSR